MTRALLEQAATILHKHHQHQTRYGRAKRAANATCANFKDSPIAALAESAYMECMGKETEALLEAIRAYLAQPQGEPAAFMTADGRVSMRETVESSMPNAARVSFNIPLYTHPAHTEAEVQEILDASYREAGALEPVVRRILGVPAP